MRITHLKPLAIFCAAVLFVCLVEAFASRSLLAGLTFFADSPGAAGITLLLIGSACALVDALTGVRRAGFLLLMPLVAGLAYLSGEKLKYLSEPLYPWDFLFTRQVFSLLPTLLDGGSTRELALLAGMLFLLVLGWVMFFLCCRRSLAIGWAARLAQGLAGAVMLGATAYLLAPTNAELLLRTLGIQNFTWAQPHNYRANGFVVAFSLNVNSALVSRPADYSPERIAQVPGSKDAPPSGSKMWLAKKPHVLMVLSESFWDPTLLPGVAFSKDPMPVARKLLNNGASGWLFSPQVGGGTANVEFEALTGFSNAYLPSGSIPYQQYLHAATPSLPRLLKSLGYGTKAYHTFHKWFWNREVVYKHLGFDQFVGLEDLKHIELRGKYPSDKRLLRRVRKDMAVAPKPIFAFVITMQNHGPYEANRYGTDQIAARGEISETLGNTLGSYAQGVYEADEALGELIDGVKNADRPTIILFFGDHLPYLGSAYEETGFLSASGSALPEKDMDVMRRLRKTPLIIWSNYDAGLPHFDTVSPMFLPYLIATAVGAKHPFYTELLGKLFHRVHGLDRDVLILSTNTMLDRRGGSIVDQELLRDHEVIQYDNLFGGRYSHDRAFCHLMGATCAAP